MFRRSFLKTCALTAGASFTRAPKIGIAAPNIASPNERLTVAMIGVRGRGGAVLDGFAARPDIEVKYVCDIDRRVLGERVHNLRNTTKHSPEMISDFRHAIDDNEVDIVALGTPDHWHAIPTIMACQAGKDVYVEKPDGHNAHEGRLMVEAAKKHKRIVQLGTQARSSRHLTEAVEYIRKGNLGTVRFAKAWESAKQSGIGNPPDSEPPEGVDYNMWLGPAPERPFNIRRFHSSWRWFFDYGTGDLGNDGVHRLDYARWGLETALETQGDGPLGWPISVSAQGGKFYFQDAQEWPDTLMVTFQYPNSLLTYEMRIWTPYPYYGEPEGAVVCGDNGYVVIANQSWRAHDAKGNRVAEGTDRDRTAEHIDDFVTCVRTRRKPAADLETVGHPSSMLCHLGNAAWRAGRTLYFDKDTYTFKNDSDANQFLSREYRSPWKLPRV